VIDLIWPRGGIIFFILCYQGEVCTVQYLH
jgi:hypothetical protein